MRITVSSVSPAPKSDSVVGILVDSVNLTYDRLSSPGALAVQSAECLASNHSQNLRTPSEIGTSALKSSNSLLFLVFA